MKIVVMHACPMNFGTHAAQAIQQLFPQMVTFGRRQGGQGDQGEVVQGLSVGDPFGDEVAVVDQAMPTLFGKGNRSNGGNATGVNFLGTLPFAIRRTMTHGMFTQRQPVRTTVMLPINRFPRQVDAINRAMLPMLDHLGLPQFLPLGQHSPLVIEQHLVPSRRQLPAEISRRSHFARIAIGFLLTLHPEYPFSENPTLI